MNLDRILADLRKERDGISNAIAALQETADDIVGRTERKSIGRKALSGEIVTAQRLLTDFFNNSTVGFAVDDDQLRYRVANPCLAAMDGISAQSHLGRTLREILGEVALQVEAAVKEVLTTGRPILNVELAGPLPTRAEAGHWVDSLFPVKDANGRVKQVGVVVVELTAETRLKQSDGLHGISANANSPPNSGTQVLRSWKEIADYVRACVKTVQRWEQKYKFPVRRLKASKGAVVFALRAEVDRWMRTETRRASQL